jgi:RHS repeat-associated protein
MFASDVRYETEDGTLEDYDPSLTDVVGEGKEEIEALQEDGLLSADDASSYIYQNTAGDSMQYLPKKNDTDTPVLLTKDDYAISLSPVTDAKGSSFYGDAFVKRSTSLDTIGNAYEETKLAKSAVSYSNLENTVKLRYDSLGNGVKESIILKEQPENGTFTYLLRTKGLEAKVDYTGNTITFYDGNTEEILAGIERPYMEDAKGERSEDITYTLESVADETTEGNTYLLTMHVSEDYLFSEDRTYPVTIDPTTTWTGNSGSTKTYDTYILKETPTYNYYSSSIDVFAVGKGTQGLYRSLLKFADFAATVDSKSVESASLTVYENGNNAKGTVINAKQVTETFTLGSVTWENRPSHATKVYGSITSSGVSGTAKTFDLTTWARGIADNSLGNYGLMLLADDESTASTFVRFYSGRTGDTSKCPKFKVVYYDKPTKATELSVNKSYLKSGDALTITWDGITSSALSYVQYAVMNYDIDADEATTSYISYSTSTKVGTSGSGSKKIVSSMNWPEGFYRLHIRGVDKNGSVGVGKTKLVCVDYTAPVINSATITPSTSSTSYSKSAPTLTWKVTENRLSQVQVSINGGDYTSVGTDTSGSKTLSGLTSEKANTIKVRAVDKAGNVSAVKTFTYYYDNTVPVINSLTSSITTSTSTYSNQTPKISWSVTDGTLSTLSYQLNSGSATAVTAAATGSVTLSASSFKQGENTFYFTAADKAGNSVNKTISYYYDSVKPVWGSTATIKNQSATREYSTELPIFQWSGITESNLKQVQYSVNGGAYQACGTTLSGEAQLPASAFLQTGIYTLQFRIVDKAGNTSTVKTFYYAYSASGDIPYIATCVTAREQVDGSTVLSWQEPKETVPSGYTFVYSIYRSETMAFSISGMTPVATGITDSYVQISGGKENTAYYYKVVVSLVNTANGMPAAQTISAEVASTTLASKEAEKNLGSKDSYDTVTFETPNGTGYAEKLGGNFLYTQTDFTLPAPQLSIELARSYNSQSSKNGILGYGWNFSYEMSLCHSNDGSYYFTDGDGTIYHFMKQEDDSYVCADNKELSLEEGEETCITVNGDITYIFDESGMLDRITEANGTYTKLVYDDYNTISAIQSYSSTDTVTKIVNLTYTINATGSRVLSTAKAPDGMLVQYCYDTGGRLCQVVWTSANQTDRILYHYAYDSEGKLCQIWDAMGNSYNISYENDKVNTLQYPDGDKFTLTYGEEVQEGTKTTVKKQNGAGAVIAVTSVVFNGKGLPVLATDENGRSTTYTYTADGLLSKSERQVIAYTLQDSVVTEMEETVTETTDYDTEGNVTGDTAEDGSRTVYEYADDTAGAQGQPSKAITYAADGTVIKELFYTYDEKGNCIRIINKTEMTVSLSAYDENGNVTETKDLTLDRDTDLSNETKLEAAIEQAEKTALEGSSTQTTYDTDGNAISDTQSAGTVNGTSETTYDSCGRTLQETDDKDRTVAYTYDGFGRCIKTVTVTPASAGSAAKTETEEKTYNANGSVATETDSLGRVTTYTYDNRNRVIQKVITAGEENKTYTTAYTYADAVTIFKASDATETVENPYVETETCHYTVNGQEETYETSKRYLDHSGNVIRVKENGLFTDYTYDGEGKTIATFTGGQAEGDAEGGQLTVTLYDKNGKETCKIINPSYDAKQESYTITEDSIYTKNAYDINGNLIKSWDENGNVTTYVYDEQARLTQVTTGTGSDATGRTYTYDSQTKDNDGKVVTTADTVLSALGITTTTTMNGAGQTLSVTDSNADAQSGTITTSYEYDSDGNQTKETLADGSYKIYTYNLKGLTQSVDCYNRDGSAVSETAYTYDADDRLEKMTDYTWKDGTKTVLRSSIYEYDQFGRTTGYSEVEGVEAPTQKETEETKITYTYDVDDTLCSVEYPAKAVQYVESGNRLTGINITYNGDKWITGIDAVLETENGTVTAPIRKYSYHNDGKVKEIRDYTDFINEGTTFISRSYTYDVFDRVTKMEYTDGSTGRVREAYTYTYDNNSNILTERVVSQEDTTDGTYDESKAYTYDSLNRLVASTTTDNKTGTVTKECAYTYDKEGNRLSKTENGVTTVYTYNGLNQLVQAVETTAGEETSVVLYTYDACGNQIREADTVKQRVTANSYDTAGQLTETQIYENGSLTLVQENTYNGDGQRISKTENGNTTRYYYLNGEVLYTTDGEGNLTTFNILGIADNVIATLRYEADANGKIKAESYVYNKDVQTSVRSITDSSNKTVATYKYSDFGETKQYGDRSFLNEICYTGGIYDASTGLYYLNARYYNPETGTFLTRDSERGDQTTYGTWHLYVYCANNPISYVDPSGHGFFSSAWNAVKSGAKKVATTVKKTVVTTVNNFKQRRIPVGIAAVTFNAIIRTVVAWADGAWKTAVNVSKGSIMEIFEKKIPHLLQNFSKVIEQCISSLVQKAKVAIIKAGIKNAIKGLIAVIKHKPKMAIDAVTSFGGLIAFLWDGWSDRKWDGWIQL